MYLCEKNVIKNWFLLTRVDKYHFNIKHMFNYLSRNPFQGIYPREMKMYVYLQACIKIVTITLLIKLETTI